MEQTPAGNGPPRRRIVLGFGLALAAALSGLLIPASAMGSPPLEPAAPEESNGLIVETLRIAGSTLRPRTSTDGHSASGSGGCIYNSSGSPFGVFNVPLQLPAGANVLGVRMYFNDTSASNSSGWFTVYDLYGEIVEEFAVLSFGNTGEGFADTAPINHLIDPNAYSYVLNWRPVVAGSTMQLCGFRVIYNPPVIFVDGFESGNSSQWSLTVP